jgi:hypothetical protein
MGPVDVNVLDPVLNPPPPPPPAWRPPPPPPPATTNTSTLFGLLPVAKLFTTKAPVDVKVCTL